MTLPQYIDEIKLRLIRLMVVMEMNDSELIMYINQARQDVQRLTIGSHRERYGKSTFVTAGVVDPVYSIQRPYGQSQALVYACRLPTEFIEMWAVTYQVGELQRTEARRYDMRELYTIGMHNWNMPTPLRPIYSVLDNYANNLPDSTMLFSIGQALNEEASIQIWYTAAVQGLDLYDAGFNYGADNDISIPTELDELVVLYAMRTVMQRIEAPAAAAAIQSQIGMHEQAIVASYQTEKLKVTSLLPSQGAI